MRLRPHSFWPLALAAPLALLAAVLARAATRLPWAADDILARYPPLAAPFLAAGVPGLLRVFAGFVAGGALWLVAAGLAGILVRRYWALWLLHKSYLVVYGLFAVYLLVVVRISSIVLEANVSIDGAAPTPQTLFFLRCHYLWPAAIVLLANALLHLCSWRRIVFTLFTGVHDETPSTGDRIIENLLRNGRDPAFRQSAIFSIGLHLFVILVLPWLLALFQHVESYRVPKGSGTPSVGGSSAPAPVPVKIVKAPARRQQKKKFIVNPHSAISFHVPDVDESQVGKEVEVASALTHVADTTRVLNIADASLRADGGAGGGSGGGKGRGRGGKLGAGGGTQGGWPDGMEGGLVRFIHLEYKGEAWDDGLDAVSRADLNFLDEFHKITGFKTATKAETQEINLLRRYKKGFAPPFVYMTGDGDINVPPNDVQILREYLLGGGLLFADCGSPRWDRSFRLFARALFPGEELLVIADDDPLFQMPYSFPNGAPPLWHHGGSRALGIKHKNRWVVFYHPGNVHDAWKTGHSGLDPRLAQGAIEISINVVYYAFTHYLEETRSYRK